MLELNRNYSLSFHASTILGSGLRNAKLVSLFDYKIANKFASIDLLHRQVYPYLPAKTPHDYTKYTYYMFETDDGKNVIVAEEWIVPNSVELTTTKTTTLLLRNVTNSQLTVLRNQLNLMGISFEML